MILVIHGIAIDEQNNVWRTNLKDGKHFIQSPHIRREGSQPNDKNKVTNGSTSINTTNH